MGFSEPDDAGVPSLTVDGAPATQGCVHYQCIKDRCAPGKHTTLSGRVYDPAGASPIYNALVYIPNTKVDPFTAGVTCDRCGSVASGQPIAAALTNERGEFVLGGVPAVDHLPVVIQVGRWRRQIRIDHVDACADNPVDASLTHLPRNHEEGDIPLFAVVTGAFDPLECLLRKVGIDDSEFTGATGTGRVHLYRGEYGGGTTTSLKAEALYPQLTRYDAVLLACEGDTYPQDKPADATYAMRQYLDAGGRVYASHFQYYWFSPYPDGAGVQPFPTVAKWNTRGPLDDTVYGTIDVSFPKGKAYYGWLENVGALRPDGRMLIDEARHDVDHEILPASQSWVRTDRDYPEASLMLTFNTPVHAPATSQCGRVVFSDMHVASQDATGQIFPDGCVTKGLTSQEKALEFMLFDLTSCVQEDNAAPSPPLK